MKRLICVAAAVGLLVTACATGPSETVKVLSEATGSPYFSLGAPALAKAGARQSVAGRVCRLGRSTLLSPPAIRVEHRSAQGALIEVAQAYVPEIYLARDQTCSDYVAKVSWTIAPGDIVRACFDRGGACPAQPQSRAVTEAPASP